MTKFTYRLIAERKDLCWIHNCGSVKDIKPVEDTPQVFSMILETDLNEYDLRWALGDKLIFKSLINS